MAVIFRCCAHGCQRQRTFCAALRQEFTLHNQRWTRMGCGTNERAKRPCLCIIKIALTQNVCVEHTPGAESCPVDHLLKRPRVPHFLSTVLDLGLLEHQRLALKTSQFPPVHHVSFSSGICVFWLADGRLATWTTKQQTVLLSIQGWFDPRDLRQDACQRVCVEVFYEQPPTALVIWDVFALGFMLICGSYFARNIEMEIKWRHKLLEWCNWNNIDNEILNQWLKLNWVSHLKKGLCCLPCHPRDAGVLCVVANVRITQRIHFIPTTISH